MAGLLQYAPWTSDIELAFYSALANLKINHDKLDSSARRVIGLYEIQHKDMPERSTRMQIHGNALTSDHVPNNFYRSEGYIRNFNTIGEYKSVDRTAHIERAGQTLWDAIHDGTIFSCPSLLASFSAICFADLKKYKFNYHFAYPALHSSPQWRMRPGAAVQQLTPNDTLHLVDKVQTWKYSVDTRQRGFFLAKKVKKGLLDLHHDTDVPEDHDEYERRGSTDYPTTPAEEDVGYVWQIDSLSAYEKGFFDNAEPGDRFICFADPSTYPSNPGWMLRNLLVLVRQRWQLDHLQVLCYRDTHARREHPTSIILHIESIKTESDKAPRPESTAAQPTQSLAPAAATKTEANSRPSTPPAISPRSIPPEERGPCPKITGWERNDNNKLTSRTVDLAAYMDPSRLADQAVDLNLKLIKWRIAPSIDLDAIKQTKCLLLGAGTLGSYVARNLMGWGVRKITFVDNAKVSYSNPVRQPLYSFKDCLSGGARKAERAAEALREIYPGVDATGHVMSVPMAGHPIMDDAKGKAEYDKLLDLIREHDAIFLLMDTRESRWLPTVMGKSMGKIMINAALGFDTYMVMRHGVRMTAQEEELGCYFCSDVVAPADSLKSATLDQQCTVTRPGVAPLASALAVELLVSVIQHPRRVRAPAPVQPTTSSSSGLSSSQSQSQSQMTSSSSAPAKQAAQDESDHPLGTVPHQLRGFLSNWSTMTIKGRSYDCCSACSPPIISAFEKDGWDFVKRAVNEKGFVEEVSGLAEVQRRAEELEDDEVDWDSGSDAGDGDGELL
ncbi:hypothetical protein AAFC00_001140 [Neodothiora populina]|uniref:Ubiquitin-like modifier-activating enzyme ATG7 n=1 Tax=Neodothiora populina TaxID=2781224 RepID=A0ABR3PN78_9PEZI